MRILFFMRSTVYVRNFESTLRLLAERGHQVHVIAHLHHELDPTDLMGRLCRECAGITHSEPAVTLDGEWPEVGFELRRGLDYLRYLEPEYADAPKLRRRAEYKAPPFVITPVAQRLSATSGGRRLLRRLLEAANRAVPVNPAAVRLIAEHRPDLVLVTPLVEPGSPQSEFVRAARALGVRTGLCVYSWDNLTNKGLIHDPLDVVTVWNEAMQDEAVTLHGVPRERVIVTGAPAYDHWFTWAPRATREEFCARVGLDTSRPYLLYLCSSKFIAPHELPFVRRWIGELREMSTRLRDIGVLIRPHPQNVTPWRFADLSDVPNVAVWPRAGGNPVDADSRADYFDSIYHSAAVVGVNTSAQIESAIVGRGVFTLLAPEFRETQEGTLHFRHLRSVNGGLLHVASNFAEHVSQLEAALCHPQAAAERCRRFVEAFVRPCGIDEAAAPRLVAALEQAGSGGPVRRDTGPWWGVLVRPVVRRARISAIDTDETEEPTTTRETGDAAPVKQRKAAKPNKDVSRKEAARAYEHYLVVREHVRRMQSLAVPLTAAEQQVAPVIADLADATPDVIADLRKYCKAITGVRASHYKGPHAEGLQKTLERDLERLLQKGEPDLLIEEPPTLGGFGFAWDGKRYNEDTLRFFRVVSMLQDAALINDLRASTERRTVWEIGGGWGGLAHQMKTLCPYVTYLITGTPELFQLSAVYLMTLFPAARMRFYDPAAPDAFWREWHTVDFAFAPEAIVSQMQPPGLDLALDVMTLERQTRARIETHVRRAHELGCRHFLSVAPVGEPDPAVAAPVVPSIDRLYWRHPVATPAGLTKRLALGPPKRGAIDRTYHLGWRRLRV